ncbi:3-isopropylmalate dehydratase small subunit [Chitinivibrio alkaliphilus]|uniref:3-isopropylmalate dehydratase n=1 Tax=Chitinivibrio alkaliphilus ACht1 TaxID=1313304 RepID=U7DA41_9BACT|nr:3-isopropylmalate dehydratase small subunit [Chitinivibrio alkaliphilus]ERP31982.1 3-isopropylmalate dehydratase small subunit [Chitinivibrio alkaliphilus ACht1]
MKQFGGSPLFLDRSDINTDEIIPAKYLTEVTKEALQPYLLEDLSLERFDPKGEQLRNAEVLITRENFGCGSSREHAPWALEVNGIHVVIAESYARIFRQNMFNCGMLALELPKEEINNIFALQQTPHLTCAIMMEEQRLTFSNNEKELYNCTFSLSEFDKALVEAGGWVEFADSRY